MLSANIAANTAAKLTSHIVNLQQIRFASTKTFLLKYRYGEPPILTQDDFDQVSKNNTLEDLKFKPIRFALVWEYGSPLWDYDFERFVKFVMIKSTKSKAYDLMNRTFYTIKGIQYKRLRKLREKASSEEDGESVCNPSDGEGEATNKIETNPLEIFKGALKNAEPAVITRKIKRGGATYQVPFPINKKQSEFLATKWMIQAVLDRPKPRKKLFPEVMAQELLDAYYNQGKVVKRKDDMHRLADANKAYAHYRWG